MLRSPDPSWLVRKGPAAGATALLATQKPDRGSIPTRLRDNIGSRAALRLPTQQSNDMALGTGKAAAGLDATSSLPATAARPGCSLTTCPASAPQRA